MTDSMSTASSAELLAAVIAFVVLCGLAGIGAEHLIAYLWNHIHWVKA